MRAALSTLLIRRGIVRKAVASASTLNAKPRRSFCINAAGEGSTPDPVPEKVLDHEEKVGMSAESGQYDVAIIGGGMVGLALACALCSRGYRKEIVGRGLVTATSVERLDILSMVGIFLCHPINIKAQCSSAPLTKQLTVAIIDSNPALGLRTCLKKDDIPDSRVSTITPATISFLKDFGAWEYVQQQRHAFFDQMQVWDYTGLGYTRYNARDVGKDYLGCVVENKVLSNSLLLCLQDKDFEKTIYSSKLTSMTFPSKSSSARTATDATANRSTLSVSSSSKDSVEKIHGSHLVKLDLSDGKSLYAKLVVGADGAKSRVREIAGLKTTGWNYSQNAVICTVEHTVENHCAWQRFLPSGPIALLPIGDKFSNIVWTMSPEGSSSHISMNEDDFVKAVNHALDYGYGPHPRSSFIDRYMDRLPWVSGYGTLSTRESFELPPKAVSVVSKRMAFPLSLMHANDYVLRRVALIGDAAHTVHPLAGQGVNLGFGDASALAKVIAEGLSVGADIGELSSLKKYEKERKAANVTMMALLDGFQKAYSVDIGPINLLRAAAFHGAQYIAPLKKNIISYAMGKQKWPFFI